MPKHLVFRIYTIAFIASFVLLCSWIFLNHQLDGSFWKDMQISKSALTGEYCELNRTNDFFHQAMNTYSNLGYFFLGMVVILISRLDQRKNPLKDKNRLQQFPLLSFFFGCCLIYLCFGSAFFHASLTWTGQRVDMNGTYSICIGLSAISLYRLFAKKDSSLLFQRIYVTVLLLIVLLFIEVHLLISSIILLPSLIALITFVTSINYLKYKGQFNLPFALLSLVIMLAAVVLRQLDVQKVVCDPSSFFQGHALWHIFTGMSAFFLYWFYRTEKTIT